MLITNGVGNPFHRSGNTMFFFFVRHSSIPDPASTVRSSCYIIVHFACGEQQALLKLTVVSPALCSIRTHNRYPPFLPVALESWREI